MIGKFPKEIFGHWIVEDGEKEKKDSPKKSKVDLRDLLNEPGALKEMVKFFKTAAREDNKSNQRGRGNKSNSKNKNQRRRD